MLSVFLIRVDLRIVKLFTEPPQCLKLAHVFEGVMAQITELIKTKA